MNVIKIIISYISGFLFIHLLWCFDSCQIIPMILLMACKLDESMSELIYIYISGGLVTYLFYYLLTHRKITKLFLYCWLFVGIIIVSFYRNDVSNIIYDFMYNHFMRPVHDLYYNFYRFKDAFAFIMTYLLCQLSVLLLYFIANSCLKVWNKMVKK